MMQVKPEVTYTCACCMHISFDLWVVWWQPSMTISLSWKWMAPQADGASSCMFTLFWASLESSI